MSDVDTTELDELQAAKVSGVAAPANGTPFLLIKAAAEKAEADEFVEEVTKDGEVTSKALSAADRKTMPTSSFAFVDKKGGKHLPIHDKAHAKAALSRFGQQDFSDAKGSAADAKQAAARKIKSAASKHDITVSDDHAVASAAKKGAVQASLNGTATPQEAGHLATGHSQTAGSVTAGVKPVASTVPAGHTASSQPGVTGTYEGGEITVVIPDEAKVVTNPVYKGAVVASLVQAIDALDEQRAAVKDGGSLQDALDALPAPKVPLTELTATLASCVSTLEEYLLCERVEAVADPSERSDVWDLEEAKCSLECALRLVAIFATMESLEDVNKSLDVEQLLAVRQTLDDAIGVAKETQAGSAGDKELIHVATVTKDELAESIAASSVAAVEAAFKAKAEKDAEAAKVAEEAEAAKNANNGGDISEADIKPTKETDADDVNAVKGEADEVDPTAKMATQLEAVTKGLESLQESVSKFAKRPRSGGPSLDGQARGAHPAAEGRQSDVTKSESDSEIETLEKSLADEKDPLMKDELGRKLTYARLIKMHESGQL